MSLPAGTAPCARTGGTPELAHAALGALLAVVPAVVAVALLDRLAAGVLAAAAVVVAAGVALPARAVPLRCAEVAAAAAAWLAALAIPAALLGRPTPEQFASALVLFVVLVGLRLPPVDLADELPGRLGLVAVRAVAGAQTAAVLVACDVLARL